MAAAPRIFISMGTPYNAQYAEFRLELERFLRVECHADPRIIGVNEYPPGNPLTHIRDVMKTCHGVMIVAYERKYVAEGAEKRTGDNPMLLSDKRYTTPWNHIESALAYSLDLPLHILCEEHLTEEGLIETKSDWYVQRMQLTSEGLRSPQTMAAIRAWVSERVTPRARGPRLMHVLEGSLRFSEMRPREIWAVIALLVTVFGAGVATGRWFLPAGASTPASR